MLLKTKTFIIIYASLIVLFLSINLITSNKKLPTIGILSNPETGSDKNSTKYVVNANYVRWLEANGMEAVAIHPWFTQTQLNDILKKINGVVFQGENFDFAKDSIYYLTAKSIIENVKNFRTTAAMNFLVFGVCSGFQVLQTILAETDIITYHPHVDSQSSLNFELDELRDSKLYSGINDELANILKNTKSIYQHHYMAVAPEQYSEKNKLRDYMNYNSVDTDSRGNNYVASAEGIKNFPFYGVQFHPEIISFNRNKSKNVPETFQSVLVSKHFGHFLLKQAALNSNTFENSSDYEGYMTGKLGAPADKDGNYYYVFEKPSA